jgi:hypothetical protein
VAAAATDLQVGGPRSPIWFVAVVALPVTAMLLANPGTAGITASAANS